MSSSNDKTNLSRIRQFAYCALEDIENGCRLARFAGFALVALIIINAATVFIPQSALNSTSRSILALLYEISTVCFCIEYFSRILIADLVHPELTLNKARTRYIFSFMGIIDLLAFLPNVISWFAPVPLGILNAITVIRLIRLIKITRYMRGMHTIERVIRKRKPEIVASFMVLGLLIIVASVLMYEVEHPAQPEVFDSVLTGVYWAVTTITTTGYGDIAPVTVLGRLLGWVIMVLSIGVVAIPGGIFSAGFVAEFSNEQSRLPHPRMHVPHNDSASDGDSEPDGDAASND